VATLGMRNVAAGANPIVLKRGIEKATQFVVRKVTDYARPIESLSDITKVATISAGNDTEVGSLIASAIDKVGREGLISLEEGKSNINELEIKPCVRTLSIALAIREPTSGSLPAEIVATFVISKRFSIGRG
jgi:chaperonin GroEL